MSNVEQKLAEMGLSLPKPPAPVANYVRCVRVGDLAFLSGHGPSRDGAMVYQGKVGAERSVEEGYEAARLVMLNLLASLKEAIQDLDRVQRVVKLLGMVNCTPDFGQQPEVINGASDLLVELYGERGRHARSAVGMASLPRGITVEIEMIVQVAEGGGA
ncbi:MAG: RidA family protein [Chloroflexi bacterium]|nr:RidA family protein [Chloroflexota bacterium]